MCSAQLSTTDREYVAGHRFMYGDIGEHVATAALLMRSTVLRPGLVLPVIRLAPVAPYGKCMALSGNSSALYHVETMNQGVWLYLHEKWYAGSAQGEIVDQTVLHELLHNELMQFSRNPKHAASRGRSGARRSADSSGWTCASNRRARCVIGTRRGQAVSRRGPPKGPSPHRT